MSNETRELLERAVRILQGHGAWTTADELRALLAKPVEQLHVEAGRVIDRLESSDPDFEDCADAVRLIRMLSAKKTAVELESHGRQADYNQLHDIISGPGDCHAAARRVYAAGYRKYEPAAHQGEPVRQVEYIGSYAGWRDVDEGTYAELKGDKRYRSRIVYAEQPAPVAVVLPARKPEPSCMTTVDDDREAAIWNACIEATARLNPGAKP